MTSVQLIVTGQCEERGLHLGLQTLFPNLHWLRPKRYDSFTSNRLVSPLPERMSLLVDKFFKALILTVDETDEETLVVAVDDLELDSTPAEVVLAARNSIARCWADFQLSWSAPKLERIREKVRRRASFHLMVPMVEAYFFSETRTLTLAGARLPSSFDPQLSDLEAFEVNDANFLSVADSIDGDDWARGGAARCRHPKRYIKYLSGDGTAGSWSYRESKHGVAALTGMDWLTTLSRTNVAASARSLCNDIADFARASHLDGEELCETSRFSLPQLVELRNI